eukprot:6199171-Pleurochrysis_carterae.AAC.1
MNLQNECEHLKLSPPAAQQEHAQLHRQKKVAHCFRRCAVRCGAHAVIRLDLYRADCRAVVVNSRPQCLGRGLRRASGFTCKSAAFERYRQTSTRCV